MRRSTRQLAQIPQAAAKHTTDEILAQSNRVPSVGDMVYLTPHRSAHGGKRGLVTRVTTSRPTSVRVRLAGCATEKLVLASAVEPVRVNAAPHQEGILVGQEQRDALQAQFQDLRAQARCGDLRQSEQFPPSWVEEVHEEASQIPRAFVARHELRKELGATPHSHDTSTMSAAVFTETCMTFNPQYSQGQLKEMVGVEPLAPKPPQAEAAARPRENEPSREESDEEEAGSSSELRLKCDEHISFHLKRRLKVGQRFDEELLTNASKQAESVLSGQRDGQDSLAEKGIKPLILMSESRYIEIQRDAAVAMFSLSINDDNKPKFLKSKALKALVRLAESSDVDIRLNVAGAIYRLSMCPEIKRPFVEEGVLNSIISFLNSPTTHVGQEIRRHAIFALKELVENLENRKRVLDEANILPPIFDVLGHPDSRVRKIAAWTLETLAAEQSNKLRMLQSGALERTLALFRVRNVEMRRAAASCMAKLTDFSDILADPQLRATIPNEPFVMQLGDAKTIKALLEIVTPDPTWETDPVVISAICQIIKNIVSVLGKGSIGLILQHEGLPAMLEQAGHMNAIEDANADYIAALTSLVDSLVMLSRGAGVQQLRSAVPYAGTVLSLCKSSHSRIRRGGARLLERVATLEEAKMGMARDSGTVPLLLSLFKYDHNTQLTAARTLAELAEAPSNRTLLIALKTVPVIVEFLPQGDEEMQYELARALADLAQAVDNRLPIVQSGGMLKAITEVISSDGSSKVQTEAIRCVANLVAPAGSVVTELGTAEATRDGEQVDRAEWRRSVDGIAWRNGYNANQADRIHTKVGDSDALSALMAQTHGRSTEALNLASEAVRHLVRMGSADFSFLDVRGQIMSHGFLRTRAQCGGAKRLESSGWVVKEDAVEIPEDKAENETAVAESGTVPGRGGVVFVGVGHSDADDASDGGSCSSAEGATRDLRTKSYGKGEYGRLLHANRAGAGTESEVPQWVPTQPATEPAEQPPASDGHALDRFFAILDQQKLHISTLFGLADKDGSGAIDSSELAAVFAQHKLPIDASEVAGILAELDTDGDQQITKAEFFEQMREAQRRRRPARRNVRRPVPPSAHRPVSREMVKQRRIAATARVAEEERARQKTRDEARRQHASALAEATKAAAAQEQVAAKAARKTVRDEEARLLKNRMRWLATSYGKGLSSVLPPIGRTPRGAKTRRAVPVTA